MFLLVLVFGGLFGGINCGSCSCYCCGVWLLYLVIVIVRLFRISSCCGILWS